MITNLKLYFTLSGSGSPALLVKLWTRQSCFRAAVPLPSSAQGNVKELASSFSSIRTNFTGLNEEDWTSFDSMLEQLGNGVHPSLRLAMSLACARAASGGDLWKIAGGEKTRFPYIAGIVAAGSSWKDFMLLPRKERTVTEAFNSLSEAWKVIGEEMKNHGALRGRTANGAWASDLSDPEILYLVHQVAGDYGMDVGVNVGAQSIWNGKTYAYPKASGSMRKELSSPEQMSFLSAVNEHYGLALIEDPFHDSDFTSHAQFSEKFPGTVVSGGDLYHGDVQRMKSAYRYRPTNAVSMSSDSLSTISGLSAVSDFAKGKGLKLCLGISSQETEDSWISDLSIAFGASILKLGVTGVGNTSKYARLLEIWEDASEPSMGKIDA
jgi:enolase